MTEERICVRGGRVIDPASGLDAVCDVELEGGVIRSIGVARDGGRVIDARGKIVAPGLVDAHVHFRDPGQTHKEDIFSGAEAASRGGFTTVVCMANTSPVVDGPDTLRHVLERAAQAKINVCTVAAVSVGLDGRQLTDMRALLDMGAVGFSDDGRPLMDSAFARRAMLAVKELDVPISLHEEDTGLIGNAGINDGAVSRELGFAGAPNVSESAMVARDCMLALDTGARVHMQHLSCAQSVELVRLAKKLGARVTAEATPQHFSLTERAVLDRGSLAKLNPPLRTEADRLAVIEGLRDGTIDMIATDHAPHSAEEKAKALLEAPSGMTGLETALALGITNLVRKGLLTLPQLLQKLTASPAALYGLPAGRIAEGAPADIVIFDENEEWTVRDFASRSANSPFIGETLTGKVKWTICGGGIVYSDREDANG